MTLSFSSSIRTARNSRRRSLRCSRLSWKHRRFVRLRAVTWDSQPHHAEFVAPGRGTVQHGNHCKRTSSQQTLSATVSCYAVGILHLRVTKEQRFYFRVMDLSGQVTRPFLDPRWAEVNSSVPEKSGFCWRGITMDVIALFSVGGTQFMRHLPREWPESQAESVISLTGKALITWQLVELSKARTINPPCDRAKAFTNWTLHGN